MKLPTEAVVVDQDIRAEELTKFGTQIEGITMTTVDNMALASGGPLLTIDQAAEYLAIPKATLYTWRTRRAGFGPRAVKIGGNLRYRRSDLDHWIAAHIETADVDQNLDIAAQQESQRGKHDRPEPTPARIRTPRSRVGR
jgi:excisionase family DNA binding protein